MLKHRMPSRVFLDPVGTMLCITGYFKAPRMIPKPIGSMGLVYLPTFTIKINHSWIGKYTVNRPMDPKGNVDSLRKSYLKKPHGIHRLSVRFA